MTTVSYELSTQLLEAIISGQFQPGERLSELELAKFYNVGRSSIREALFTIERLGLIERIPRQGARVINLTAQGLLELFVLREALEGMCARLAAQHITKEEGNKIEQLLREHEAHLLHSAAYHRQKGEEDFHYLIFKASHNQLLNNLLGNELYPKLRMYRHYLSHQYSNPQKAIAEHRQILNAVLEGDGELAELLMRRHISRSCEQLLTQFTDENLQQRDKKIKNNTRKEN